MDFKTEACSRSSYWSSATRFSFSELEMSPGRNESSTIGRTHRSSPCPPTCSSRCVTELLGVGWAHLTPLCLSLPRVHPFVMLQPLQQQELTRLCIRATSLTTYLYARHYYVCIRVYYVLDGHCLYLGTRVMRMR